jgi:hypothetical protein
VNLKAQYYQEMADAFERGEVQGLKDDVTIGQLAGIIYEVDSHGRIKIESKESARARGIPSPDRAEALMLALCKPPQKYEWHSIRELGLFRSDTNDCSAPKGPPPHPFWGFTEVPSDPAEDMRLPRRWPRGWEVF